MNPKIKDEIAKINPFLTYEITDDGVGVFDNVFTPAYCNGWINKFEKVDAVGGTYNRMQAFNRPGVITEDDAIDYSNNAFYTDDSIKVSCQEFLQGFWKICYALYSEKYSILKSASPHKIFIVKLQRTKPQGGYHAWHFESADRDAADRLLTFILYLNDIDEGGETEFLYLSKRIKPKAGRLLIFPSGFVHTHRGNPPLTQNKYIMTGWVEF